MSVENINPTLEEHTERDGAVSYNIGSIVLRGMSRNYDNRIEDPDKAWEMAKAEDPFREEEKFFRGLYDIASALSGPHGTHAQQFDKLQREAGQNADEAAKNAAIEYDSRTEKS